MSKVSILEADLQVCSVVPPDRSNDKVLSEQTLNTSRDFLGEFITTGKRKKHTRTNSQNRSNTQLSNSNLLEGLHPLEEEESCILENQIGQDEVGIIPTNNEGEDEDKSLLGDLFFKEKKNDNSIGSITPKVIPRLLNRTSIGQHNCSFNLKNDKIIPLSPVDSKVPSISNNLIDIMEEKYPDGFNNNIIGEGDIEEGLVSNNNLMQLMEPPQRSRSRNLTFTTILDQSINDLGKDVINQYTLLRKLGEGAFAEVRKAKSNINAEFYVRQKNNWLGYQDYRPQ